MAALTYRRRFSKGNASTEQEATVDVLSKSVTDQHTHWAKFREGFLWKFV